MRVKNPQHCLPKKLLSMNQVATPVTEEWRDPSEQIFY